MTSDHKAIRGVLRRRRRTSDPDLMADLQEFRRLQALRDAQAIDLLENPAMLARGNALDGFVMRPHARAIGERLAVMEERAKTATRFQGLIITTPPQVGKSTLVTEWGSFWWLALDPTRAIMCACYGDDLAVRRGQNTQALVTEHGRPYGLELRHGSTAAKDWSVTAGGGMRSIGIGSGATGFSADRLVIDDPLKDRRDAQSKAKRDQVWDWCSSTGFQRLQPGAIVIVVMTPWHEDDLRGRLIKEQGTLDEGGRWDLLHIPGFADPEFGPDPLGRAPGEPLPHPKIPMRETIALRDHWDDKKATMTTRDFFSLIQGDPRPAEGALLTSDFLVSIRDWDPAHRPEKVKAAVAVDPSGGGRDTAGIVGGFRGTDGRLWYTHDRSGVMDPEEWARQACILAAETGADVIILESNFGGKMVSFSVTAAWNMLRTEWIKDNGEREEPLPLSECPYGKIPPMVKRVNAKAGKLLRAEPIAQQFTFDKARLAAPMPHMEHEWSTWQPDDPDSPGRVDASVYLAYELLSVPGASEVISAAKASKERTGTPLGGARIRR